MSGETLPPLTAPVPANIALLQQILGNTSTIIEKQDQQERRLVRVETRLVNLLKHAGVDPRGID